jgi:hypothetical protein
MSSEPIYKVFVSSTFQDLREERAEVQKALLKINCLPVGMELFPAADEETWSFIKTQIDDADYYIVLVAGRYGALAPTGISFTEMEYDYAREKDIPSIGFVHADRSAIPSGKVDTDLTLTLKLDTFIKKLKTRPIREFNTPHQLATEVIASFIDLKRTRPRVGFVRTNQAVEYKKYAEVLERATQLESRLATLQVVESAYLVGGGGVTDEEPPRFGLDLANYGRSPASMKAYALEICDLSDLPDKPKYLNPDYSRQTFIDEIAPMQKKTICMQEVSPTFAKPVVYGRFWYQDIWRRGRYFSFILRVGTAPERGFNRIVTLPDLEDVDAEYSASK